jgi:ElaB/YqjD/DUF883 family membrane-anchored ribosome-binding protein
MFNLIKNPEIKENAEDLVENAKLNAQEIKNEISEDADEIAAQVKKSTSQLGKKLKSKSVETKQDDKRFLSSIRHSLDTDKLSDKSTEFAEQLVVLTDSIKDELIDAFKASIAGTEKVVRKRTLLSLSIALGAGLTIGYVLAKKGTSEAS